MYFILFIAIAVASYAVQSSLKSKFSTYSKTPLSNGMTGAQVAEKMLRDNGINNVKVTQIEGQLTDLPRAPAVRHRLVCTPHTVLLRDTPC